MGNEADRKSDFNAAYTDAWTVWGGWQAQAKNDLHAITKNAWTAQDIAYMRKVMPEREIMSFNQLRRPVRLISNFERMNRLSIRFDPVEGSDAQTAEQLTTCANDAMARSTQHGYHVKSDCFESSLKTGMALFNLAKDRNDNVLFDCFRYNQFVLHPHFTKRDLSDCQFGILRKHITEAEAKMFFPGKESFIADMVRMESALRDDKFANYAPHYMYGKKLLALDEFTQRTTVSKRYWVDSRVGHMRDMAGNKVEYRDTPQERQLLFEIPSLDVVEEMERTVSVTQYLNGEEVYFGIDPWGIGDFSFTPFICFFDPDVDEFYDRIQSMVRCMKDPQRAFDRRTMANIRALECTVGAGIDVEEGVLVDDTQAYLAGPGHPRFFKMDAINENRYRDRPAPNLPAGWLEMQKSFENLVGKVVGLDEDGMLGVNQKDQLLLGVVGKMRLGLGLAGMFDLFDNASLAHQVIGHKMLKMIQQYPAEKVQRILGEEPTPSFYAKEFGQYDAIPCETVLTDTQRNTLYTELVNLKKLGAEIGDPPPIPWSVLFEYAPIALKSKLSQQLMAVEQQRMQAQQRMQQIQEATQQAVLQQLAVDTANEKVHIQERVANVAQRTASAEKTQLETAQLAQELNTTPTLDMLDRVIEIAKLEVQQQGQLQAKKERTRNGDT